MKKIDVISLTDKLMADIEEKKYEYEYVLDCLEYYFAQMMKNNLENKILSKYLHYGWIFASLNCKFNRKNMAYMQLFVGVAA